MRYLVRPITLLIIPVHNVNNGGNDVCKTPPKPRKRVKYDQKYKLEYRDEFRCMCKSTLGDTFAFCNLCRCDVNIAHGGRYDI